MNKEIKVGLLAVVAITIFYIGFNFLKGQELFSSKHTYYTVYDHTAGLSVSHPVFINGFSVGRVKHIKILPNRHYKIVVAFDVAKKIKLPRTTTTKLISSDLLGSKAIELIVGKTGDILQNHDTVAGMLEKSLKDVFIENAIPVLDDIKTITCYINDFLANLYQNTNKINMIFTNLEEASQKLKQIVATNQGNFNAIGKNIAQVSNALTDEHTGISSLLTQFHAFMGQIENAEIKKVVRCRWHLKN